MLSIASMLITTNVHAAEEQPRELWEASAELGFVSTTGNTETETLNAKAEASTDRDQWRHAIEAATLKSSDADTTTAQKFTLSGQSDYKLEGKKNYLFGLVSYENEKFSGYDYRVTETIGYGRRVIEDEDLKLDLEIGPGARQSKLDSGESDSEGLIYAAAKLKWQVGKNSQFREVLTVDAGEDVTVTKSVTSLSSKVNGNLSMKVTFTYKNTSDVPVGVEETDTETGVTLVYAF